MSSSAFPSYLRHLALVARDEMGIDPRSLGIRMIGSHLGIENREPDRGAVGRALLRHLRHARERHAWRPSASIQNGMHIKEDAFILEIADPETGSDPARRRARHGLHHHAVPCGAPQIRFNINDVSACPDRRVPVRLHLRGG